MSGPIFDIIPEKKQKKQELKNKRYALCNYSIKVKPENDLQYNNTIISSELTFNYRPDLKFLPPKKLEPTNKGHFGTVTKSVVWVHK